jgi:hypothetical protein
MTASEFRELFRAFAGTDRYRRFIQALNPRCRWRGRFLYWQEQLLSRFAAEVPVGDVSFERVEPLLRVCELHWTELAPDTEGYSHQFRGAILHDGQLSRFPNTDCGPVVMGPGPEAERRGVWRCLACVAVSAAEGPPITEHLIREITLEAYGQEFGFNEWGSERWAILKAEIGSVLAAGGELWEFETPGFQSLAGESGLAVVRDGRVIRRWPLWKS